MSQGDAVDQYGVQTVVKGTAAAAPEDHDFIICDSNGTVTGGQAGSIIELYGTDDNGWFVSAHMQTSGTLSGTAAGIA